MNEAGKCKVGGQWQQIKVLGSGGFGQVTLWQNVATAQKIAIKRLLEGALNDLTVKAKITERWCNEVEIMKKLNHINIIATLEIPPELRSIDSLPVLAMEYCSHGDLRQVLNKPENCYGLSELEVLNILKDISSGLAYLHSCKIIHRDIKPDNIVLQEKGSNIIYKLIDLGYAKALDQSSLSKSFVGTVQYIAPELFMGKAYTSSVDYWSFGLVAHEIITGYRPFLPGYDPSDWMKRIQNKSRNIICVQENSRRGVEFNSRISRRNRLSRPLLEDIEKWLQLALDWDGQTRGRDSQKGRLVIFENLTEIICKRIINVFSLPTYEVLSYEINRETDVNELREWLKTDVDVEKDDQILLLPCGKCVNPKGNLFKYLETGNVDGTGISLFLFNSKSASMRIDTIETPVFADELRDSLHGNLKYRQLKRCCADTVYYLQTQANHHRYLLQGIRARITNTKQKTVAVEQMYEDLENELNRIEYYGHFLSFSLKTDLENYIHYRKAGKLKSSSFVRKWIQNTFDVNNKIAKLKNSFNKTKQRQLMLLAKQRCRNLDDHANNNSNDQETPLDRLVEKAQKIWDYLQSVSRDESETQLPASSLVGLINKAVEETGRFLNSQMLKNLFVKLSEADENFGKFFSHLTNIYSSTNVLRRIIENTQTERQKEVWSLIENPKRRESETFNETRNGENFESADTKSLTSLTEFDKNGNDELGVFRPVDKCDKSTNDLNTSDPFLNSDFVIVTPDIFPPSPGDVCSVIADNNHLRYRIQEIQQSCNKMVKEINSLNWDFISESDESQLCK